MVSIVNWLLFVLVNGILLYASWCVAGYLNTKKDTLLSQLLVSTGLVYFAQITVMVLFLGAVVGYLHREALIISSTFLAMILIYCFRAHRHLFLAKLGDAIRVIFAERDVFLYFVLVLFIIQVGVLIAKVVMLPPHIWDVFYYHLTPAVEWYQQGRIPLAIDTPARHMNNVPLGMTVLSYWFFIFFRHDFLVELPMLLWSILLVPLSYAILRKSEVGPAWALKFAVLIFFIPIVLLQGITVKDHLGLNIAFLAGLFFLVNYLRERAPGQLFAAALAFGLMLGYKQAAPVYIAVAAIVFMMLIYLEQRDILQNRVQRKAFLKAGAWSVVLVLLVGGYWLIKKALVGKLNLVPLPPPAAAGGDMAGKSRFGLDALLNNAAEFLPRVFDYSYLYDANLIRISGFGPQFAAFGLLALVVAFIAAFLKSERQRPFFLIMSTVLILFLLFLATGYSGGANSYRILSFLPMVMIAYAAILLYRNGILGNKAGSAVVNLLLTVCIVWNLYFMLPPQKTNLKLFREYISMDASYRTSGAYTRWFSVHRPNLYRLLAAMPEDEPVAIVSQPIFGQWFRKGQLETWSYPYYDRRWRRRLVYFYKERYLECAPRRHLCRPTAALKRDLAAAGMHLVSSCPTNRCVTIVDRDFIELTPGFYYFRSGK